MDKKIKLSPIAVFAFKRIDSLRCCIESLLANPEAKDSDMIIFVDGPRSNNDTEYGQVRSVREYVKSITGFKSLVYNFSEINKGLAQSVIEGISEVINDYGDVIVVEDDLIVSQSFLRYMNDSLTNYRSEKKVFSISGYTNICNPPTNYKYSTYFCTRSTSWGWATWKDRWSRVDFELRDWKAVTRNKKDFNNWGGSDNYRMLEKWHNGLISSWSIRFDYSMFIDKSLSLFPIKSLVKNNGYDGTGSNCKYYNRFKSEFYEKNNFIISYPHEIALNLILYKQQMAFNTIKIRIKSRILNTCYSIINVLKIR